MTVLDRIGENLESLRTLLREGAMRAPAVDHHNYVVCEPVKEAALKSIEQEFEVSLPAEYRAFLAKFGDTRVGPGTMRTVREGLTAASKRPFPLSGPVLGSSAYSYEAMSSDERKGEIKSLFHAWEAIPKQDGVLGICDYGDGIAAVLVLNGPFCGRVWVLQTESAYYGPFGGSEPLHDESVTISWTPNDHPRDYSFFEWYESWLNGKLKMAGIFPL